MQSAHWTVVIVNDVAHVNGGAGQIALSSARELARRGHSVVLFSAVGPPDPSLEQAGVRIVCTNQLDILDNPNRFGAAAQGIWNRKAADEMADLLRALDPRKTLVHVHAWTKAISSSIIPVALAHGSGLVVTIHEYFLACPNGGFFNFVSGEMCHLKPLSAACVMTNCDLRGYSHKLWRVGRQHVQLSVGRLPGAVRHFITISRLSRSLIEPYLPAGARLYDIGNPIDAEMMPPVNVGREKMMVCVGRLASEKGPLLAAEASRWAQSQLKFIGDGYMRGRIEAQYPECAITGWTSHEEVQKQLERSRVLVFPSLWYEAQPLVVLEAAARGVPAVVADTSAARESVIDGETGLWFRRGDVEDLAQKLRMLQDDDFVTKLGAAAYSRFWASAPMLGKHVDQLEQCYQHVLES
jgi:glycosyltransferase involved in cell wall biosynthesis